MKRRTLFRLAGFASIFAAIRLRANESNILNSANGSLSNKSADNVTPTPRATRLQLLDESIDLDKHRSINDRKIVPKTAEGFSKALEELYRNGGEVFLNRNLEISRTLAVPGIRNGSISGKGAGRLGENGSRLLYRGGSYALMIGDSGAGTQEITLDNFHIALSPNAQGGIQFGAMRGSVLSKVAVTGATNGAAFDFHLRTDTRGNAGYANLFSNLVSRANNIGLRVRTSGGQTSKPYANTVLNFEYENPRGKAPVAFDLQDAPGWTFLGGKVAGTGRGFVGYPVAYRLSGNSKGVSLFGGHYEQCKFIQAKGDSSLLAVGYDASFKCDKVTADSPELITLIPSHRPFMKGYGYGQPSANIAFRSDHSGGLFATQTHIAGIQGASLQPLNPNSDFAVWPVSQGYGKDSGLNPSLDRVNRLIAGVWEVIGECILVERSSIALFGKYSMKITDYRSKYGYQRNRRGIRFSLDDDSVLSRMVGHRICMSSWVRRADKKFPGNPGLRVRYKVGGKWQSTVSYLKGSELPELDDSNSLLGMEDHWAFLSVESSIKMPKDLEEVEFAIEPVTILSFNIVGSVIIDGVVCSVGGIRVFDSITLMGDINKASSDVYDYMMKSGANTFDNVVGNRSPNYIGERIYDQANGAWLTAFGLGENDWAR